MRFCMGSKRKIAAWGGRLGRDTAASQIAEAALVLPLVFMMLLGIYWFGRAFNIYATINHAAREVARAGAAQSCGSCSPPNAHLLAADATVLVDGILHASSVDPNQIILDDPNPPPCPGFETLKERNVLGSNNNIVYYNYVLLTPVSSPYPPVCGVRVTFQYPYQFWLPFTSLNQQQIILTADVQMKGEY